MRVAVGITQEVSGVVGRVISTVAAMSSAVDTIVAISRIARITRVIDVTMAISQIMGIAKVALEQR